MPAVWNESERWRLLAASPPADDQAGGQGAEPGETRQQPGRREGQLAGSR
jgi:hypothetical protein